MVRRINLFLVALALVGVIAAGQVQALLAQSVSDSLVTIQDQQLIQVQRIEVTGSTIFGEAEFKPIIELVEGRTVTIEELRRVADAISQLYIEQGYITSRAVIVEESLDKGVAEIRVIEGSLKEIQVEGTRQIEEDYIRSRLRRGTGTPLNVTQLEDELLLLRANPLFENVEASLRAGTELGQSILIVRVTESFDPIRNRLQFNEHSSSNIANASLFERLQLREFRVVEPAIESEVSFQYPTEFQNSEIVKYVRILNQIKQDTGVKPAFIFAKLSPNYLSEIRIEKTKHKNEVIELFLLTYQGKIIRKRVLNATLEVVTTEATKLRRSITNPILRRTTGYLQPAQQLYNWLMAPLDEELNTQGIQNITFIMDADLRSLPIAALHDGKKFLVEKYSLGLTPSISLTNTDYVDIKNAPVLAMGISESSELAKSLNLNPLPSVPLEVKTIVELRGGQYFLNEKVTLPSLQLESQDASIVHLATHSDFQPGSLEDSYILLWNELLRFDQLRELNWSNRSSPIELLVLSADRTAVGDEKVELGLSGLAVQAGVKSVLASLWYVSDEGTMALMIEFYRQLQTAPIKAEALRQAQLAMLHGDVRLEGGNLWGTRQPVPLPPRLNDQDNKSFTHPYYWAAFTMIGSPW
ncbi:CHAT domain-containing protein [Coleofasciculus sp. E1-EBD-02]|uniref:CHAT domain-containing protein n=1 Tax=Coleofasciculus sp. E1-EBD-02 TaxID=3068481 RepID=UPI003302D1E1